MISILLRNLIELTFLDESHDTFGGSYPVLLED